MKKNLLWAIIFLPIFCNAQLQVKDTIINKKNYHIYPFRVEFNEYNNYGTSLSSVAGNLPQIPSVTDPLPVGDYVMLTPEYWSSSRVGRPSTQVKWCYIVASFSVAGGMKNGPCIFYDSKGKIQSFGNYKNDLRDGNWEYKQDKYHYKYIFNEGIINGTAYQYEKKKLVTKANYAENKMLGDYFQYYTNGKISYYTKYIDEVDKGQKKDDFRFDASNSDSLEIEFYKNGNLKYKYICNKGWRSLNFTNYYSNGKVERESKVIKYIEDEDRYLVEVKNYDQGKYHLAKFERYKSGTQSEYSRIVEILEVNFDEEGDTVSVYFGPQTDFKDQMESADDLILQAKFYTKFNNKNRVTEERYYNIFAGMMNRIYDTEGKITEGFDLKYSADKSHYTWTSYSHDRSGRLMLKSYYTYKLDFDPSMDSYNQNYSLMAGSDTVSIFYDNKPLSGTIVFPTEYELIERHSFLKKMKRSLHRFKKNYYYYDGFSSYNDFKLWGTNFSYIEMKRGEFYKKYGGERPSKYEKDSMIKCVVPAVNKKLYKLKPFETYYLKNFILENGKYEGKVNLNTEEITFKHGIKEGLWGDKKISSTQEYGYFRNGLRNGEFVKYSGNYGEISKIIKREHYINDTLDGFAVEYDKNIGQPNIFYRYDMGKKVGPYIEINALNNDTLFKANLTNGLVDGKVEKYTYKVDEAQSADYPGYDEIYGNGSYNTAQDDKPKKLIKEYILNIRKGKYIGKQYEYGKSGYLLQMVDIDDSVTCGEKLETSEYSYSRYNFNDGVFRNSTGMHTYYYKSGSIAEKGKTDGYSKKGIWNYYREDGSLFKQIDFDNTEAKLSGMKINEDSAYNFNGIITTYHINGKVYEKGYVNDYTTSYDCNQERELQDETVTYISIQDSVGSYIFKDGSGDLTIYNSNGVLKAKGKQLNWMREGFWIFFDPKGNPIEAGNYIGNNKDGRWLRGDLRGFHFIDNQCFSADVDEEILKYKAERNLAIEETIYKLGVEISSNKTRFEKK